MSVRRPFGGLGRVWFPLALVALLVVFIPGLVLFTLNLIGREGLVNKWLEDNLRLSYHLPIPWWGALLLFLVPPLLILLYFLKLKRKPLSVPSTFLWKKSIEDLRVNSLFQWLRNNVLLLLQLLVLLALVYAILAPRLHGAGGAGKRYILMIDNSASMSATDVAPSRLEWAKAEALKEIDAASDNDVGMLIVFNSRAEIRQSYTSDRSMLRLRVREIEPTEQPTQIEEALQLADSLANPRRSTENEAVKPTDVEPGQERTYAQPEGLQAEVHLYSDGRFPGVSDFALGNLMLQFHAAGEAGAKGKANVGIVAFNAVRDESQASLVHTFARLQNGGEDDVTVTFELVVSSGGNLVKAFPPKTVRVPAMRIEPGNEEKGEPARERPGEASVSIDVSDLDDQTEYILKAQFKNHTDILKLDDEAWLVLGVVRKARVLIVGKSNPIIKAFFDDESTAAVAEVKYLSADDFANADTYRTRYLEPARNGAFDLVIFDRCAPAAEEDMPRGNTYFIGTPPPPWKLDGLKKVEKVFVKGGVAQHSVMRYLTSLFEIGVGEAVRIDDLPPKTPRLLEGDNNVVLLAALTRNTHTDLVQTFPLISDTGVWNSNWPLLPSFPIFLRNVLYSLGNVSDAASEDVLQPGQPKRLRPGGGVEKVEVITPEGRKVELERVGTRSDFDFSGTDRIGVYGANWEGGGRSFAVNLLDPDESLTAPRDAVRIGNEQVLTGVTRRQSRELWKWAVVAGLLFLLLEWYVYNRRVYV